MLIHPAKRRRAAQKRRRLRPLRMLALLLLLAAIACSAYVPVRSWAVRLIFRPSYVQHIEHYSAQQDLSPALVCAVVFHESRFDPQAVSRLGARGLMQLMPETAEWIAGKLDEEDSFSAERMFDPETNLRYGCWYLGFLSRLFGGDAVKIAAGYHAGQNAVASWLDDPAVSPDGTTLPLENIPYPDTKQYAERVISAYDIYRTYFY